MESYVPPLRDIRFTLEHLVDLAGLSKLPAFAHADPETVYSLLEEYGRFVAEVIGPLDRVGDTVGSVRDAASGSVATPPGFVDAYRRYNSENPSNSHRIGRLLVLDEPPSIDANEITDKGYINQRAALETRCREVERLHAGEAGPDVIAIE